MEKNNKDRGFKIIAIVALLLSVVGLSIAYAGYTSTLTVEGTLAENCHTNKGGCVYITLIGKTM
ncbi:MAG: hypothetical protein IJI22_02940 [Bacilli bacterium]|nr:hypothetical protein [Bacilli bacterium]